MATETDHIINNNIVVTEEEKLSTPLDHQDKKIDIHSVENNEENNLDANVKLDSNQASNFKESNQQNEEKHQEKDKSQNSSGVVDQVEKSPELNTSEVNNLNQSDQKTNNSAGQTKRKQIRRHFTTVIVAPSKCEVCDKSVYPMEKVMLDGKVYHQNCFRCCKCKKMLSPTVVSKSHGNLFCKPHYIELFRMRGKYDDIDVNKIPTDSGADIYIPNSPTYVPTNVELKNTSNTNTNLTESVAKAEGNVQEDAMKNLNLLHSRKGVSAKDLAKKFQEEQNSSLKNNQRKPQIDIGMKKSVSNASKDWSDGKFGSPMDSRRSSNASAISELAFVNETSKGSVRNLTAMFEPTI